jgi:sugar phosphate isomerase/epimerase
MKKALHTKSVFGVNLITALTIASEAGFGAVEIVSSRLDEYLKAGFTAQDLKVELDKRNLEAICINDICHIESPRAEALEKMLAEAKRYSSVAKIIGCKYIQLVPLVELDGRPWQDILSITAANTKKICEIGEEYGVAFQLEAVAWSPFNSLAKGVELIDAVGMSNLGMVVDTWHFYASSLTTFDEIAAIDPSLIYNIHFCDGKKLGAGGETDEEKLRGCYFGDGDISLDKYAQAINASGYKGWWSVELVSSKHWQMDALEVAKRLSKDLTPYLPVV